MVGIVDADPAEYRSHALHSPERSYGESNCYTDVLIELLHARGEEPLAMMGCVLRLDFEGDQWTFFKPAAGDLEALYGLDVHEMQPYRPLPVQIEEQLVQGRTLIVELDSFYLPDTAATSYRSEHVKSSVAAAAIDRDAERLRYFHATGLHELAGEDYRNVFRLGREFSADVLPPYTELARFDAGAALRGDALRAGAFESLRVHLAARPADNPFVRFGAQLERELPDLLAGDAEGYHAYAFATVRMAGSAFEIAATYADWLFGERGARASAAFTAIVDGCKLLSFKLARRRPFEPAGEIRALAARWDEAMAALDGLAL